MPTPSSEFAVLFADVSGSTRMYEELGDARALSAIGHCLGLVRSACDGHAGRLVKTIGDEAMAVFQLADDAAQAAAEMQARVTEQPAVGTQALAIRVGFHFGPAIEADGDFFGDSVNVAARLVGVAHGAQVILSAATAQALSPWLRARTREVTALTVKGKLRDMSVCELVWRDSVDDLTTLSTRVIAAPAAFSLSSSPRPRSSRPYARSRSERRRLTAAGPVRPASACDRAFRKSCQCTLTRRPAARRASRSTTVSSA